MCPSFTKLQPQDTHVDGSRGKRNEESTSDTFGHVARAILLECAMQGRLVLIVSRRLCETLPALG